MIAKVMNVDAAASGITSFGPFSLVLVMDENMYVCVRSWGAEGGIIIMKW